MNFKSGDENFFYEGLDARLLDNNIMVYGFKGLTFLVSFQQLNNNLCHQLVAKTYFEPVKT